MLRGTRDDISCRGSHFFAYFLLILSITIPLLIIILTFGRISRQGEIGKEEGNHYPPFCAGFCAFCKDGSVFFG